MSNETNDGARIEDLERRLAKAEEQLARMAFNPLDELVELHPKRPPTEEELVMVGMSFMQERAKAIVERHLGRPPTAADLDRLADDVEHLSRGEKLSAIKSVAAADVN